MRKIGRYCIYATTCERVGGRELPERGHTAQTAGGGAAAGGRTPGTDGGHGAQRGQETRREATEQGQ